MLSVHVSTVNSECEIHVRHNSECEIHVRHIKKMRFVGHGSMGTVIHKNL